MTDRADLIIIGAGFYGLRLALRYGQRGKKVIVLDSAAEPMTRASYINQARIHNGYHYPRSYTTAKGAHDNYARFISDYKDCVAENFTHLYAVARQGSQLSEYQFKEACDIVGAPLLPVRLDDLALFNQDRVAAVFRVEEAAFNARAIRDMLLMQIAACDTIRIITQAAVTALHETGQIITVNTTAGDFTAAAVLNVSYSNLNDVIRCATFLDDATELLNIDIEIAEVCLCQAPAAFDQLGVTIMDGPFWASLPFPADNLHSLTHVRYTPHTSYSSKREATPPEQIAAQYTKLTNFHHMRADAARYMPLMSDFKYQRSLFTNKAIVAQHEYDDARPILVKRHTSTAPFISVLGSKLDGIYALESAMDQYL